VAKAGHLSELGREIIVQRACHSAAVGDATYDLLRRDRMTLALAAPAGNCGLLVGANRTAPFAERVLHRSVDEGRVGTYCGTRFHFAMPYSPAQRCLDILEVLANAPDGLPLSSVGARLALPKSATHRFLTLLESRGFVRQVPLTQHYRLTLKLPQLAFRYLASTGITDIAQPVLDALATRTGELARLAIVDGDTLTWVAKAQGAPLGLRYDDQAGREVILHATATGKVWLATLPEAAALAIVERAGGFDRAGLGPNAVTSAAHLSHELRVTRNRGWGEAVEEGEPGVAAVAATIRARPDDAARVVGTVSIAGPLARMDAARRVQHAEEALAAARELTELWPARAQWAGGERAA
jgi:IclR family acetate operon transcriptional repressor